MLLKYPFGAGIGVCSNICSAIGVLSGVCFVYLAADNVWCIVALAVFIVAGSVRWD